MDKMKKKWGKDVIIMTLAIGLFLGVVLIFSSLQKKADLQDAKKTEPKRCIIGQGCYGQ